MKRKLYFCEKCFRVYAAEVNNGRCLSIEKQMGIYGDTRCNGTIRPIDYEPPKKDDRQRDIEEQIAEMNRERATPAAERRWNAEQTNVLFDVCPHLRIEQLGTTGDESDWVVCLDCGYKWRL